MARAQRITQEQIESARRILQELPAKDAGKSKKEAVTLLAKELKKALRKGYEVNEICVALKNGGIKIPASLIKSQTELLKMEQQDCSSVENISN